MKAEKLISFILAILMTLTVFTLTLSPVAFAMLDQKGSITLHVANTSGKPLEGTTFRLYFIASAHQDGSGVRYEFISPYDKANISIDNLQDSYLPVHLTGFAVTRSLPYVQKSADKDGEIVFDELTPGLYLVVPYGNFEGYYLPAPFVINIPQFDSGEQKWEYDIVATPKMIIIDGASQTQSTYLSVQKKWETEGEIPESISVVLLRDLEVFARVELNKNNNWYYRWNSLPKSHVWNVVEEQVPDGFEVSYDTSSNTVKIINKAVSAEETTTSAVAETQPVTSPGETATDNTASGDNLPGHTSVGETTLPSQGDSTDVSRFDTQTTTTTQEELIDTGQLNWPVPVLAISGLLVFSIGWAILNLGKKETEY